MVLNQEKYIVRKMNNISKLNENFMIIKTRKYKDINLYLRFSIRYSLKKKASLIVLSKLFGETSNKYPSKSLMSNARDNLYGINVCAICKSRNDVLSFNVQYGFINPKFLDIKFDEYLAYIKETLFNTIIDKQTVKEAKNTVVSSLLRRLDKPAVSAREEVIDIVSKDYKTFKSYSLSKDLINEIRKLNENDIREIYNNLIAKAQLHIYVCGDVNKNIINKFNFLNLDNRQKLYVNYPKPRFKDKKEIIVNKKVSQSNLYVVYKTPYNSKHKDFYAWAMGNIFLGVVPTSLLFEEVRERLSLCYSISAIDFKKEGLVFICTNIDGKNKKKVCDEINYQINRLINKDYDENKLEMSKILFMNIIESTYDDQVSLVDYYYENALSNIDVDLNEYCRNISKVSADDISRVFKNYKPYFTYMLKGNNND